ncbi:MAG: TrmH family RNA methyltransferase [Actinomycetaceae bacterium]|nr:TrmH family RNA methyltransferase [Actinomycetaceae bacterium]
MSDLNETVPKSKPGRGLGPWPGGRDNWPEGDHYDPELLENGDARNVEDRFRYWKREAIKRYLDEHKPEDWLEVAIENLGHDFNIGSIVRTANSLGVRRVHIVGRRRWNRRGAMVTDKYLEVVHHPEVSDFYEDVSGRGLAVIGIDNIEHSVPLEGRTLPRKCVLVMGEESAGLSPDMVSVCETVAHITQYGSSRSMNVGHAAAIAMWSWVTQHRPQESN